MHDIGIYKLLKAHNVDMITIANFHNGWLLLLACWVDGVGMAWAYISYGMDPNHINNKI